MENSNHVSPNCNGRLATQPMILTLDLLRFKSTLLCRIQLPAAHLELTLQLINILCLFIYLFIYLSIYQFIIFCSTSCKLKRREQNLHKESKLMKRKRLQFSESLLTMASSALISTMILRW